MAFFIHYFLRNFSILNASTADVTTELLSFRNVSKYLARTSGAAYSFHIS